MRIRLYEVYERFILIGNHINARFQSTNWQNKILQSLRYLTSWNQ